MYAMDKYWMGLIILQFISLTTSNTCKVGNVRTCQDFSLIRFIDLHVFIAVQELDEMCSRLEKAMSCVYTTGQLDQCDLVTKFPFDTQRGVINAVCDTRRLDYLNSVKCFHRERTKTVITKVCLPKLVNSHTMLGGPCGTTKEISDCARNTIQMTDGCSSSDADFMSDLMDIYLQPAKEIFNCSVVGPATVTPTRERYRQREDEDGAYRASVTSFIANHEQEQQGISRSISKNSTREVNVVEVGDGANPPQTAIWIASGELHAHEDTSQETTSSKLQLSNGKIDDSILDRIATTDLLESEKSDGTDVRVTQSGQHHLDLKNRLNTSTTASIHFNSSTTSMATESADRAQLEKLSITPSSVETELEVADRNDQFWSQETVNNATVHTTTKLNVQLNVKSARSTQGAPNSATTIMNDISQIWVMLVTIMIVLA
uniref:Uncharacterized protein n=1 Tax=Arion vulgaris TaxID=1028688 RepID=A0A0B7BFX1_9EUPU